MKKELLTLLFVFSIAVAHAQHQDYKSLLDKFYQHSKSNFQEIMGKQTDTTSIFYPSLLSADLGKIKIGKFPYTNVLSWEVPLDKSQPLQAAVRKFIEATYSGNKMYKIVSEDEVEEPEGITTNSIYLTNGDRKPLLVFQTICYRDKEVATKSRFAIMLYGK